MTRYIVSDADGTKSVTAYIDGETLITNTANPNWNTIMDRLFVGEEFGLAELFNAEQAVIGRFKAVSERVSVRGGVVYFDGDPIEDTLSEHLLTLIRNGDDVAPLVNFWERIAANPDDHARENLLRWLEATKGFTITSDGMILGYKGLRSDSTSIHAGPGIVDGTEMVGNLPNNEGSVVEIARSKVTRDSYQGCASGLHVGTWEYASGFAQGVIVEVLVNPRDVVSVPTDCAGQKMRVCRYKVGKSTVQARTEALVDDYDNEDDFAEAGSDWESI